MSRWRPTESGCLYVIPDIQGALGLLEKICARILPLRKSDGIKDKLVFLGDFIDRHVDSPKVLDFLIELKKKYKDQVVFVKGNHENIFLSMMNLEPRKTLTLQGLSSWHKMWIENGGMETLQGYLDRADITDTSPLSFPRFRIADIVPKEHIEFLQNDLVNYYKHEHYIFIHGGLDPSIPVDKQEPDVLWWDRSLMRYVLNSINFGTTNMDWEGTIITGHNGPTPIVHEKYMMLDVGSPRQLLVVELNSMEAFIAYPNKSRLVKYELKETVKKVGSFRRVSSAS